MSKIMSRKQKAEKIATDKFNALVKNVALFTRVKQDEKVISITHPDYNKLTKDQRDLIFTLVSEHRFYIQWEIFDIPTG